MSKWIYGVLGVTALMGAEGCALTMRSGQAFQTETARTVEQKTGNMKACYDAALKSAPGISGTVETRFHWEKSTGKLTNLAVTGGSAPDALKECVKSNLEGLTVYPPDANEAEVAWTFTFKASDASVSSK